MGPFEAVVDEEGLATEDAMRGMGGRAFGDYMWTEWQDGNHFEYFAFAWAYRILDSKRLPEGIEAVLP
jgi:hypothetical protein